MGLGIWKWYNRDRVDGKRVILLALVNVVNIVCLHLFMRLAIDAIWSRIHHFWILVPVCAITLEVVFIRRILAWLSVKFDRSIEAKLPRSVVLGSMGLLALSFLAVHGVAFLQILSQKVLFLRIFSYALPPLLAWSLLCSGVLIAFFFVYALVRDIFSNANQPAAFIMVAYLGLFTMYTRASSIRYFLIPIVMMSLYLGSKLLEQHRLMRRILIAVLVVNILVVQAALWFLSSDQHRQVKAIDFKLGNMSETSAHFLRFDPVVQFIDSNRIGRIEHQPVDNAEAMIGCTYRFYKLMYPRLETYPNVARIDYEKNVLGDGFRKEIIPWTDENRARKVRDYVKTLMTTGNFPGIQYYVACPESVIFRCDTGFADVKNAKLIGPETKMVVYSLGKVFTAVAILQLVDEGKLSLDNPVSKYLTDFPYGNGVTIRHLLSQTSGIPNPIPVTFAHLVDGDAGGDGDTVLRKLASKNPKPQFAPGAMYAYSDLSYWYLEKMVENIALSSYEDYVRKNIFQKLNQSGEMDFVNQTKYLCAKGYLRNSTVKKLFKSYLIDTKYYGEFEDSGRNYDVPSLYFGARVASALILKEKFGAWWKHQDHSENGWLPVREPYPQAAALGGMVSSAQAISVFLRDMLRDTSVLFSGSARSLLFEQQRTNSGQLTEMSLGWHVGRIGGAPFYYKEGGGGGFRCQMRVYPSNRIATVVIVNSAEFNAPGFLDVVDKEFLWSVAR